MRENGPTGGARSRKAFARIALACAVVGGSLAGTHGASALEESADPDPAVAAGETLYTDHCAKCHGEAGAGEGQLAAWLDKPPPDLTVLARRNGGTFPFDEVLKTIDGTEEREGHAPSDMPVWGEVLQLADREATVEEVAEKLRALTLYVRSLQRAEPAAAADD